MDPILLIVFTGVVVLCFYIVNRLLTEKRKYENAEYLENLQRCNEFLSHIQSLSDYVNWVQRDQLKSSYRTTGEFFRNKSLYYQNQPIVGQFNEVYENLDRYVVQYNQQYVQAQKEKLKQYFDNIEGKKLDEQQRHALITDEYSNLIIAGAGSGKTLTILGKVLYLVEQKKINPRNILLLSFTQKTVEELNERLRKIQVGVVATTFHKLGYDQIKKTHSNIPAVTNENSLSLVISEFLRDELFNYPEALKAYIQYVSCYMNIPEGHDNYNSLGEKIDTEKGIDFQTLKAKCEPLNIVSKTTLDTLQGERVKSVEELIIANFLFLNGVEYEYEKPYPHGETMYRPDFYLPDYTIYLEHFGVDENNRAQWLTPFNEQKYIEGMEWKRETHKTFGTKLLETYSYFNRDNILLQRLQEMLEAENVVFKPRDTKDIYTKVADNDKNFGGELKKLIESFINLSKSRQLDHHALLELYSVNSRGANKFMRERKELFLQFVIPILKKYDQTLTERNEIDFNDMINLATKSIQTNKPHFTYQYIIIDEYQDISVSRFNLIKEIRDLSGARLVCVGDDWQSIYRFAGSDISLFSNFQKYVGPYEQLVIEQTYRNSQALINATSRYIQKNPRQIAKSPKSRKEPLADPVQFVQYKEEEAEATFMNELNRLVAKYGNHSILVLGRHAFDINNLIKRSAGGRIKYIEKSGKIEVAGFEELDIRYLTVHKSKGTEADNVILLNLKNHLLGFPNKMTDDPILAPLLNDDENYRFAEERRLFYVALTRTRNEVVLMVPPDASLFVEELMADGNYLIAEKNGTLSTTSCPYCKTGKMVIRQNPADGKQFLGCSHYPNCNQTFSNTAILENSLLCPSCRSGYLVKRSGNFSAFLGCTNFPVCRNTVGM